MLLFTFLTVLVIGVSGKSEWWETMSLYQIYPRSFMDSDGDGIGDLKGIQSKLQHLVDSKINAFWLSPVYKSPMVDFGYDISDFKSIDPTFGTMEDFDDLLREAHRLNLKLIMDFVPNHSSDQHEWFQKSIKKIDPYTDYYIWHPGKIVNGTRQVPNNWLSVFDGDTWTWNEERQAYYFHHFTPEQPDMNFRNPHVVEEFKNILRFWLDKGVDGFRVDAIADLFEFEDLRDEPLSGKTKDSKAYDYLNHDYTNHLREDYEMVRQWRDVLDEYGSRFLAMEIYANVTKLMEYYAYGATFPFNYDFIDSINNQSTPQDFKKIIDKWWNNLPKGATANWAAGNHDRSRIFSRLGRDFGQVLTILVQLLPGAAVTYYGEEIGMADTYYTWDETVDPWAKNRGIQLYEKLSRDKVRAPFPWNNSINAGFSRSSTTWLHVDPNYQTLNLVSEKADKNSYYNSFLKITSLREWPAVRYGSLQSRVMKNNQILAFSRDLENERPVYVVVNFANVPMSVSLKKFKRVPDRLQLYHSTIYAESGIGKEFKSDYLRLRARSAKVYVGIDSSESTTNYSSSMTLKDKITQFAEQLWNKVSSIFQRVKNYLFR